MFKLFKNRKEPASFDPEELRRKNNEAIRELLEWNEKLENSRELRDRYQNRKQLEKAEMELSKECEKRRRKLNFEKDVWMAKEQELDKVTQRSNELLHELEHLENELIYKHVLRYKIKAAKEEKERIKKLNSKLEQQVKMFRKKLCHQNALIQDYRQADDTIKKLQEITVNYLKEIKYLERILKPGTDSKFTERHDKKKNRKKVAQRLTSLVLKLNSLEKDFDSLQPDLEKYVRNVQRSDAAQSERSVSPAERQTLTGGEQRICGDSLLSDAKRLTPSQQNQRQEDLSESEDEESHEKLEDSSCDEDTESEEAEEDALLDADTLKEAMDSDDEELRDSSCDEETDSEKAEEDALLDLETLKEAMDSDDEELRDSTYDDETESEDDLAESHETSVEESDSPRLRRQESDEETSEDEEPKDGPTESGLLGVSAGTERRPPHNQPTNPVPSEPTQRPDQTSAQMNGGRDGSLHSEAPNHGARRGPMAPRRKSRASRRVRR